MADMDISLEKNNSVLGLVGKNNLGVIFYKLKVERK